jgi:hypothetical protein
MFINIGNMRLKISPDRLISDVQKDFNAAFPYLKLAFFRKRNSGVKEFSSTEMLPLHQRIGKRQTEVTDGDIDIHQEMKVKELENIFRDQFCLAVQVLRKSGNHWLETSMTDNWTLLQQNTHGRELTLSLMSLSSNQERKTGTSGEQNASQVRDQGPTA